MKKEEEHKKSIKMWKKYPKMKNLSKDFVDTSNCNWVLIEKIHGSNFSINVSDKEITYARRNDILKDDEQFYDFQETMKKYKYPIKQVWELIKLIYSDVKNITIYGEYFGGKYNETQNPNEKVRKPVQREVLYSNEYNFIPFDIKVYRDDNSYYLDWTLFYAIIYISDFKIFNEVLEGTFEELSKYDPNNKQTQIPALYKLDDIPGNYAEGFILRPVVEMRTSKGERIMFKHKADKFSETIASKAPKCDLPDEAKVYLEELVNRLNKNRLNSVVSKETEITEKDFGRLLSLLMKDAVEDIDMSIHDSWKRKVYKLATPTAVKLVKEIIS